MRTREFQDLRKKDTDELLKLIDEKRTEVLNLRFSQATGALENSALLGGAKRDVARILTVLGEKQREQSAAAKTETTA